MERSFLGDRVVPSPTLEKEVSEEQKVVTIEKVKEALEKSIDRHLVVNVIEDIFSRCLPDVTKEQVKNIMMSILPPKIEVVYFIDPLITGEKPRRAETNGINIMFSAREFYTNNVVDIAELLHVYIHEALHVVSVDRNSYETDGSFTTGVSIATEQMLQNEPVFYFYNKFNEALTELLADAVQTEYLTRKGEASHHKTLLIDEKEFLIERPFAYQEERIVVQKIIKKIVEVSGFSNDQVVRAFVREYFTNGYLGRDEIVEAFKGYPEVYSKLKKLGNNFTFEVSKAELEKYEFDMISTEFDFVKALFGRDVIGQYNKKVVDSL